MRTVMMRNLRRNSGGWRPGAALSGEAYILDIGSQFSVLSSQFSGFRTQAHSLGGLGAFGVLAVALPVKHSTGLRGRGRWGRVCWGVRELGAFWQKNHRGTGAQRSAGGELRVLSAE